jgi:hypothetical protein
MRTFYNRTTVRFARLAAPASAPKGGPVTDKISIYGLTALVCALCLAATAQAQTSWWRTYGGTDYDCGRSVQQTADGGYIVVGATGSFGAGDYDVYLIKTTPSGYTLWTRTYGGTDNDFGYSVQQTSDGGYIFAGLAAGKVSRVNLIKTDASGDTLWTRTCGGADGREGSSIQQTSDGGYIVTDGTGLLGQGSWDVYLVKTNASGDTLWTRIYGGMEHDLGRSVQQTADSGYVVAGYTWSFGAGSSDVYLMKTDASGDTLWARTYGGTGGDVGYSVQQTSDGGYIVAGVTASFGAGQYDVYLIKTDASGDTLWTRTYGGPDGDGGYSVQQISDGGYIIAGITESFGAGLCDVYLIKTDANGDTLWTRTYGGTSDDFGYSVRQSADGGYVIAGYTASFGAGSYDVYLIKTDSLGSVGVAEESPKPQVMRGRLGPTVLSGASGVRCLASGIVFDAMGRRVLHPKAGIYFLRTPAAAEPRKVLLVE